MISVKCFENLFVLIVLMWGFDVGAAWFETCDHVIPLAKNGAVYINSPLYPKNYTTGSSCRYEITVPMDNQINMQCNIELDQSSMGCTTEIFYVSTEGNRNLVDSGFFCGKGYIQRGSTFQTLVLAYTSAASQKNTGRFSCLIEAQPTSCECGWGRKDDRSQLNDDEQSTTPSLTNFVHTESNKLICEGTIVSYRYVLTAASCFESYPNSDELHIHVGYDKSTARYEIAEIKKHPQYEFKRKLNNIAAIQTKNNIEWSLNVGPVCLPFHYSFNHFVGDQVELIGWNSSSVLEKQKVKIVENSFCETIYPEISSNQICIQTLAGIKDQCLFNVGGPLLLANNHRLYLIGIANDEVMSSCGPSSMLTIQTRVTTYLNWINSIVGSELCVK